jgi:hypothetical protein
VLYETIIINLIRITCSRGVLYRLLSEIIADLGVLYRTSHGYRRHPECYAEIFPSNHPIWGVMQNFFWITADLGMLYGIPSA